MTERRQALVWVGSIAGAVVALGGAWAVISGAVDQLVFRHHLDKLQCEMQKSVANVSLVVLESELRDLRAGMRRSRRVDNEEVADIIESEIAEDERREELLLVRIGAQTALRDARCDD